MQDLFSTNVTILNDDVPAAGKDVSRRTIAGSKYPRIENLIPFAAGERGMRDIEDNNVCDLTGRKRTGSTA